MAPISDPGYAAAKQRRYRDGLRVRDEDTFSPEAISRAVTDLIAHGDLPRKIT